VKVLFDTQIFDWQINGGISRYFIEVFNRLKENSDIELLFKCRHSYNTYIQETPWLSKRPVLKNLHFKGKLGALKIINQKINRPYSNRLLQKKGIDIFHPTYYDPYFLPKLRGKPMILTVYDLTNEKYNDHTPLTTKVLAWKKELIAAAAHIIAISENTRKDVIEYYGVAPEKVTTVYLSGGFDEKIVNAAADTQMDKVPARYILFVGSRGSYKNFTAFVEEVAPVLKQENVSLAVAGGGPINGAEATLFRELDISDKVVAFSHVSDTLLAQLYKQALVFIFPSLYEGFGLPVLEAMQCECPALLSNNSSLPEVGGNAAAYFDPLVKGALQQELLQLLKDEQRRTKMIQAGLEQVKKFNWDATAQGHIDVYKKMAL
jgi:glycosyltransferase involved in cell wall biosynthesis